jgi:geranylgeranyl pyrophosphate synthase
MPQLDTDLTPQSITQLREEINDALISLQLPENPKYLYYPLSYVFSGKGKRLRPILLNISGESLGASEHDLKYAGIAVELLHNFTLVHDDIMDQDDIRHGKHTIHKKWDESTAILAGDGIYVLSLSLIAKVKTQTLRVVKTFNEAALMVCEGQAYDKQYEYDTNITMDDYIIMVEKKTGFLIGLCTELGGILGNQSDETIEYLKAFGTVLGTAFQIQDDMLEIMANEESMGKSLGSDLTKGKQTILSILARKKDEREWDKLNSNFKDIDSSIREQKEFLNSNGIIEEVKNMIHSYINRSNEILKTIPEPCNSRLKQFTELILNRDH